MKILHITASYKPAYIYGGPIQSVAKLCEEILAFGASFDSAQDDKLKNIKNDKYQEIEIFTTTANGKVELDIRSGIPISVESVPVTYFKRWTKDHSHFSPALLWHLNKVLRHFVKLNANLVQYEDAKIIIHIHAWWNLISVLSCLVAKWYKIPVILSPRGMLNSYTQSNRNSFSKKVIHQLIGKSLLRYAHVHATSEQEKVEILKIVSPRSIIVIPNLVSLVEGVPAIKYQVASNKDLEEGAIFNLIFLSRIEEKKGLELLFDALSNIKIDFNLTIAGTGDENYVLSLKRKTESLKLDKRIKWVGQVGAQDKFELLAKHNLLVLNSYNENFANVVIESLSVGTPVLISEQVGLADYVKTSKLGWTCELNSEHIKEQIMSAYHDQTTREMIRNKAPKKIRTDFNDEVLVKRYIALYEKVLQSHSE